VTVAADGATLGRLRPLLLPTSVVAGAFLLLGGVILLSQRATDGDLPPEPPVFSGLPASPLTVMDVKQRAGNSLTLVSPTGAEVAFAVPDQAVIERLAPVDASEIAIGDTINVIGIPNEVLSFSIHLVVLLEEPATSVDGHALSAGGFAGHEAALDRADRPIISGVVEAIAEEGDLVTLATEGGEATLRLNEAEPARVHRLELADADAIAEGDRVAAEFDAAAVASLLVMPAGD